MSPETKRDTPSKGPEARSTGWRRGFVWLERVVTAAIVVFLAIRLGPQLGALTGVGPSLGSAKYYIAIGNVNVRGGGDDVASHTRAAMRSALSRKSGYAFAPAGETTAEAKKRLRKYPSVHAYKFLTDVIVDYSGGDLTVEIQIGIHGYPDMQSQGSLSQFAGASTDGKDEDKEKELLDKIIGQAMKKFDAMASSVR